jgi:hypothetical protein
MGIDPSGHKVSWDGIANGLKNAGKYVWRSGKQVLFGNYTKDITALGTGGQVLTGFFGVDLPGDVRDIYYDVSNWENSSEHYWQTGLDAVSFIPLIGMVKYSDEAKTLFKHGDMVANTKNSDNLKSLYRAVGPDEFYEIMETGKFNVIPIGMQAKQFGLNFDETLRFAEKYKDIGAIIEIKVPANMLDELADFTHVDGFIFKNGTITIQAEKLDEFNKIIQEITHKY